MACCLRQRLRYQPPAVPPLPAARGLAEFAAAERSTAVPLQCAAVAKPAAGAVGAHVSVVFARTAAGIAKRGAAAAACAVATFAIAAAELRSWCRPGAGYELARAPPDRATEMARSRSTLPPPPRQPRTTLTCAALSGAPRTPRTQCHQLWTAGGVGAARTRGGRSCVV